MRNVICNAQGFFSFENVKDGEYFLVSHISWKVTDYRLEGGSLLQKVKVKSEQTVDVVLSP